MRWRSSIIKIYNYDIKREERCESKENVTKRVSMDQKKMLPKPRKNVEM